MREAVALALAEEMRANPDVFLLGEDIAAAGGSFKATDGLLAEFGPSRVRDTPISEMGFLGAAVGAAVTGLRPVVEIMFMEFLGVALDQLVTQAAKMRYLSAGRLSVPLVVRGSVGAGLGFGAQHSQTLESWMIATPGLKVAVASGPSSVYGLLRAAIRDDNPVVVCEPRSLYGVRETFEPGDAAVPPLGSARTLTKGDDLTIVALGAMVPRAMQAVSGADGWSAEVIDLGTLIPWDRDTVLKSVQRTGRLLVLEESPYSGGWGAMIAAEASSELFGQLSAPVLRLTCPDVSVPFNRALEARYLPTPEYVRSQVARWLESSAIPPPWWTEPAR
jgi:acetoin:2,6-dichlorophenolindophenol oxidoreductase subunit beta